MLHDERVKDHLNLLTASCEFGQIKEAVQGNVSDLQSVSWTVFGAILVAKIVLDDKVSIREENMRIDSLSHSPDDLGRLLLANLNLEAIGRSSHKFEIRRLSKNDHIPHELVVPHILFVVGPVLEHLSDQQIIFCLCSLQLTHASRHAICKVLL